MPWFRTIVDVLVTQFVKDAEQSQARENVRIIMKACEQVCKDRMPVNLDPIYKLFNISYLYATSIRTKSLGSKRINKQTLNELSFFLEDKVYAFYQLKNKNNYGVNDLINHWSDEDDQYTNLLCCAIYVSFNKLYFPKELKAPLLNPPVNSLFLVVKNMLVKQYGLLTAKDDTLLALDTRLGVLCKLHDCLAMFSTFPDENTAGLLLLANELMQAGRNEIRERLLIDYQQAKAGTEELFFIYLTIHLVYLTTKQRVKILDTVIFLKMFLKESNCDNLPSWLQLMQVVTDGLGLFRTAMKYYNKKVNEFDVVSLSQSINNALGPKGMEARLNQLFINFFQSTDDNVITLQWSSESFSSLFLGLMMIYLKQDELFLLYNCNFKVQELEPFIPNIEQKRAIIKFEAKILHLIDHNINFSTQRLAELCNNFVNPEAVEEFLQECESYGECTLDLQKQFRNTSRYNFFPSANSSVKIQGDIPVNLQNAKC